MLTSNHLYRKIERNNLFRTFSKKYSRPTRASTSEKPITSLTLDITSSHHPSYTHTIDPSNEYNHKLVVSKPLSHRLQHNLELSNNSNSKVFTKQITIEKEFASQPSNQFSRSVVKSHQQFRPRFQQFVSESTLPVWNRGTHQKFKLKPCLQKKPVHYETQWQESDFSILELKRKAVIQKFHQNIRKKSGKYRMIGQHANVSSSASKKGSLELTKYSVFKKQSTKEEIFMAIK